MLKFGPGCASQTVGVLSFSPQRDFSLTKPKIRLFVQFYMKIGNFSTKFANIFL